MSKNAEKELQDFLAAHPPWVLKALYYDLEALSGDELTSWFNDLGRIDREVRPEYENIIRQIPAQWNKYLQARRKLLLEAARAAAPKCRAGAPRKDVIAEEAAQLKRRGMNFLQVAAELKKQGIETTPEAIRKLLKRHSKPDKT